MLKILGSLMEILLRWCWLKSSKQKENHSFDHYYHCINLYIHCNKVQLCRELRDDLTLVEDSSGNGMMESFMIIFFEMKKRAVGLHASSSGPQFHHILWSPIWAIWDRAKAATRGSCKQLPWKGERGAQRRWHSTCTDCSWTLINGPSLSCVLI